MMTLAWVLQGQKELMQINVANHIENRRLFDAAAGLIMLEGWEREHLHSCAVCQAVFYVFIRQPIRNPLLKPPDPDVAA